jgi:FixJ family two-component response regulator
MTGADLSKELLKIRPDVPIILCTGFSEVITEGEAKRMGIREFLMKPLTLRDIAVAARKVLDRKEG